MKAAKTRLQRYAYMRLAREFDARFELMLKTGRITKWYSAIGNEGVTVPAGLALEAGDVLCSLHRDLGAILAYYLDPARAFPDFGFGAADGRRPDPERLLFRLACQVLGRDEGFSRGVERSYHYGYFEPEAGLFHVGMISHLGAMIPVAAGCAFALKQRQLDRVAINFIGEGGTSTGDFHEAMNLAAVWKLPLVLIVENNRYAFSTPARAQYACLQLSDRGPGYGIPAETIDGSDPDAVAHALEAAIARARTGKGPTLIEAMIGRLRGHAEGDGSMKVVPPDRAQVFAKDARGFSERHRFARRFVPDGIAETLRSETISTSPIRHPHRRRDPSRSPMPSRRVSLMMSSALSLFSSPRRNTNRVAVYKSASRRSFQAFHSFGLVPAMSAQVNRYKYSRCSRSATRVAKRVTTSGSEISCRCAVTDITRCSFTSQASNSVSAVGNIMRDAKFANIVGTQNGVIAAAALGNVVEQAGKQKQIRFAQMRHHFMRRRETFQRTLHVIRP